MKLDTGKNSSVKIIPEVSQCKRLSLVIKIHLGSKEYKESCGGDDNVLQIGCDGAFTGIFSCQYSSNCTL